MTETGHLDLLEDEKVEVACGRVSRQKLEDRKEIVPFLDLTQCVFQGQGEGF